MSAIVARTDDSRRRDSRSGRRWEALYPEADVVALGDVGHYVPEEAGERYVAALERFWRVWTAEPGGRTRPARPGTIRQVDSDATVDRPVANWWHSPSARLEPRLRRWGRKYQQ